MAGISTATTPRARELGDLLRARRERVQPADVNLPAGTRLRTRGLRREEVAQLAVISPTYHTFLEQGRDVRPSRQVLGALAAAAPARYRAAAGRHLGDPAFEELTTRLHEASAKVRAWWPRHEIAPLSSCINRLRHPTLGELELHNIVLEVADDPEQRIVTFVAGEHDHARIAALLDAQRDAGPANHPCGG